MKRFTGTVVSTKSEKTAVVKVDSFWKHPIYKKRVKRSKKYLVHSEEKLGTGDQVIFGETRPLSRRKKWKIIATVQKKKTK